ncbi:MAG: flippase-like domain-containing protein [Solirubrobacterales bacterium]|nr:flippase-like domain-containing protein [Solirubrobacterales bacterium]
MTDDSVTETRARAVATGTGADAPSPAPEPEPGQSSPLLNRKRMILLLAFVPVAIAAFYFLAPNLAGLERTWDRIQQGSPAWLALALVLEMLSFASYVLLFRAVFGAGERGISWRASYEISLGGVVATRLLAAGGAGGIAFIAWGVSRLGMAARDIAWRLTAFLVLQYAVFMGAVVIVGVALYTGLLPGSAPFSLTIVPALLATGVIVIALAFTLAPRDLPAWLESLAARRPRLARVARYLATVPATLGAGVRGAIGLVRSRDWRVPAGAIGWWAFDIATLWACFHAFGGSPNVAVVVLAYFVGQLGNLIPLPGGVGGVEGATIAALIGFGVPGGLALVAVLAYRGFAFWLPMLPGALAYFTLRRTLRSEPLVETG